MTDILSRRSFFMSVPLCVTLSVFCPLAAAEVTRPAYTPPPPAVSSGSIVQIVFSLLLVLVAIVLVLGAVAVGQRERIVLVEIKDTWLLVGVGSGQIRTLHTLQKSEDRVQRAEEPFASPPSAENKFASLLSSVLKKRAAGNK
jgi:flagellar protein FliO/FliZ